MVNKYENYIIKYFDEIKHIIDIIDKESLVQFATKLEEIRENHQRLFIFGVGGSAANASHAVNDFRKILGIETYSPMDNVSELTARINDDGWESSFKNWAIVSKLSENDHILVLSVGGGSDTTSQNLVQMMRHAKKIGANVFSIVSRDGGYAKQLSDVCIHIPVVSSDRITPHAEEWQGIIWHMLVSAVSSGGKI
jgi:D-sedoheptulose 7-phosphate isomerase